MIALLSSDGVTDANADDCGHQQRRPSIGDDSRSRGANVAGSDAACSSVEKMSAGLFNGSARNSRSTSAFMLRLSQLDWRWDPSAAGVGVRVLIGCAHVEVTVPQSGAGP